MRFYAAVLFCCLLSSASLAQETGEPPKEIKVGARKNPGNVAYRFFIEGQRFLRSYLPPEPRMLDVSYRISFTELPEAAQDAYEPAGWAISVVGDTVDEAVPVRRGGYFEIPEIPQAEKEGATLMFKEQSKRRAVGVSWIVRVRPDQRFAYADFGKTMAEIHTAQKTMPFYRLRTRSVKYAKYDGIKACFRDAGGAVIEFSGPLDIVTMVETADYPLSGA